jgi:hypothetical protein
MFTPCIIIGAMIRRDAPEFLDWMEMEPPISESFGLDGANPFIRLLV